MTDIDTFVKLKYNIITNDRNTWNLCDTYPDEVLRKWRYRYFDHISVFMADREQTLIEATKYRDGLITFAELKSFDFFCTELLQYYHPDYQDNINLCISFLIEEL